MFRFVFSAILLAVVAACTPGTTTTNSGTGQQIFTIRPSQVAEIQYRQLDAINELRRKQGAGPLQLSPELIAAAKTHAFDMARQNRPWHFGSDGSSPIDRVARAGYSGRLVGENISETYEDDLITLQAWMNENLTRSTILDPAARFLGVSWFQESTGKIWWVLLTGT